LTADEIRRRVTDARVAILATVASDGHPHLVPMTFVISGDALYSAVDHKPKTTSALKRLANLRRDPRATVLVHTYDEDWTKLWWCRLRGIAEVLDHGVDADRARELLAAKYEQYREKLPSGPVIAMVVDEWTGWSAS